MAALSALASVIVIGVFSFWGGFARRWISDDGLIVLRTVRNLEEGNGPVFNIGERVEANTSTLWQYLILLVRWLTNAPLESIAVNLGLLLAVAAMVLGAWATARAFYRSGQFSAPLVAPAGALVYLALPPARDFFTSGLEWGLSIFYLAALWALLQHWAQSRTNTSAYWLALWAGLAWLVRPEFALYGGLAGLLLLAAHRNWKAWLCILGAALPIPAGYQFFRMGYYGLLTPHTAVAKSASSSAWDSGLNYLQDFIGPYALYLPVLVLAGAALWTFRAQLRPAALRSSTTVTYLMVGAAAVHVLYVLRVGGDFMHGRMLLLPLFAALLPVFVMPLKELVSALAAVFCAVWAVVIVLRGHPMDWEAYEQPLSIVDERDFWTYATNREAGYPPRSAKDYLGMKFMRGYEEAGEKLVDGDALATIYVEDEEKDLLNWLTVPREPGMDEPPTVYLVNLGMTSMNAPLNVRVLDTIGLATPLAARMPREEGGRVGHDKHLDVEWQAAQTGADIEYLPPWYDKDKTRQARAALASPEVQELIASYSEPLTRERFLKNLTFSLTSGRTLMLSDEPSDYPVH
ncbi:beta-(1-_2)-arabinofuranosyltransferase [Corynebacterium aurimucosum]